MKSTMTRLLALAVLAVMVACSHAMDLSKSSSQADFGVQMAKMDLWREALFRFQRAVEINPRDAMARNNLAVAYEANGEFEKARKEYLEALQLDRSNQYIQKNYSRFVEFLSRNRKRQPPRAEAEAKPQPVPAAGGGPQSPAPAPAMSLVQGKREETAPGRRSAATRPPNSRAYAVLAHRPGPRGRPESEAVR